MTTRGQRRLMRLQRAEAERMLVEGAGPWLHEHTTGQAGAPITLDDIKAAAAKLRDHRPDARSFIRYVHPDELPLMLSDYEAALQRMRLRGHWMG